MDEMTRLEETKGAAAKFVSPPPSPPQHPPPLTSGTSDDPLNRSLDKCRI